MVGFGYSYVADENNIYRKTFDHRAGDPYNEYAYDDLDRLTDVEYHDSDTEAFVMDALGNRTGNQTLRDDGAVNFTVDSATNRYTAIGGNSISHDEAGNLTVDKDGYKYSYDYENRVVKIQKPDGSGGWDDVAEMAYDVLGRRIRVIDSVASATTLYYYNPEWQCLAEYNGVGALQRYFVYGNYIDEPLIMKRHSDGKDYYYGQDHLYSTVVLIDDGGTVVERYEYDAYGTTHIMDASYNPRSVSAYGNPYTFTGRRLDILDGGNKEDMYYRWRYYSPPTGRFLQQDPLGVVPNIEWLNLSADDGQMSDGLNLYCYVSANPISHTDALGLRRDPHGERDPEGRKKAKASDKCFCITSMTMYGYKVAPSFGPPRTPGGPRSHGMHVGAHLNINIHGYWKPWPYPRSCGLDGRAEVHWWEWFTVMPTQNRDLYEGKATHTWHDLQSRRITHPFKPHYSYHDEPGVTAAPGMGSIDYEARILAAAMSHPDCQCPGLWACGASLHVELKWPGLGGLYISRHDFEIVGGWVSPPEWPERSRIVAAFKFRP